jgi:YegS/Rv2252/BmrU family lipid kinase
VGLAETLVIVNPVSRGGRTGRLWPDLEPKVRAALGPLRVEWTRARGDAERIASEALSDATRVIVAGGDGTASEVATGLLRDGSPSRAAVGLLPLGTGSDLPRAIEGPRDLDRTLAALASGRRRRIDAGRITVTAGGTRSTRFFLNAATAGLSATVVEAVGRIARRSGHSIVTYAVGGLAGLARWTSPSVRVTIDGAVAHDGPLVFVAACNGRYFGGGMHVAPEAEPDDGLLDVVIVPGMARPTLLRHAPRLYRGTHGAVRGVRIVRGTRVEITSDVAVAAEADGDWLGHAPAAIELLPGAIELLGS